jgi:putative tricarboxylic transport membrane protein
MLDGLRLFAQPDMLLYLTLGVVFATAVAVMPGLGGLFAMTVVLPFTFKMDAMDAIALVLGTAVVTGTANTVTSVLIGVPGSASGVASVLDGYPMAQRGEGSRAISAGVFASLFGGLLGAGVLAVLIPIMRPFILRLGPAEFAAIIIITVVSLGALTPGEGIRGFVAALLGLLLSFVGIEASTGTVRFAFGQTYLWDGIPIVPMLIGLFAIAEMWKLVSTGVPIASSTRAPASNRAQIWQGFRDVVHHWRAALRSSAMGIIAGLAPGVGGGAAQFMGYGAVVSAGPEVDEEGRAFGEGRIDGVIAADAGTNSIYGSSLVPTLALGIPGSIEMAVLLALFVTVGIRPGPSLLGEHRDLIWMIIFGLVFATLVTTALTLGLTPILARIAFIKPEYLIPPILLVAVVGAYATTNNLADVIVAVAFGVLGVVMTKFGYSRVPLVIGFVLGPLVERYTFLAWNLYGTSMIYRPALQVIVGVTLALFVWRRIARRVRRRRSLRVDQGAPDEMGEMRPNASGRP